ncbi:phage integrase [Vibrio variabilis]|uniref:Phage integrase n=1 Tax=Vibrio variabilis TaxID=990271 RepID=A0ABQ0JIM0_9VIBR|nr:phage integrase [Vibrio variabilis]
MAIRNLNDGSNKPWLCECYPHGRSGKRIRKRFATKGEASAYQRYLTNETNDKPWCEQKADNRRLSELVDLWFTSYGITLANGAIIKAKFHAMVLSMGNPLANTFNAKMYSEYRSNRMSGKINFVDKRWAKGAPGTATLNSELARFKAMFNKLKELGEWSTTNPLEDVKPFKQQETPMAFLSSEQITLLLETVANHRCSDMLKIVKLCLCTGARWNEAAQLKGSQLSMYKVTYTNTKTRKNRSVPISKELYSQIFKPTTGKLFQECYTPFCYILKNKLNITLPKGQASHVLRHSFASHFMMNGGNILVLRDILGHADISMTMRYAHFAPDHLSEAVSLNPISRLI